MSEHEINKIISDNLNRLMKIKNVTQLELAEYMNVSQATVSNWCKNIKMPRMDKIDRICTYFNINRSDLMEEKQEYQYNISRDSVICEDSSIPGCIAVAKETSTVRIPVLGNIPAGVPLNAIEDIKEYIDVPQEWKNTHGALMVVGDSMEPKFLKGDIVIFKMQSDCESGQDCIVYVNGYDATLKKVIKKEDCIILQPLNPKYEPKVYYYNDKETPISILGVVVELRRKLL